MSVIIRPVMRGEVWAVNEELVVYSDRDTGKRDEVTKRSIDLLVREPERGTANIAVYGDEPPAVKEGDFIEVPLRSFSMEKGAAIYRAGVGDIRNVQPTKKGAA